MPRIPRNLMIHKADLYTATTTQVGGAISNTHALAVEKFACRVQDAGRKVVEDADKHEQRVTKSIYLVDLSTYNLVTEESRIVHGSTTYQMVDKKNLSRLNRVFRLDVVKAPKAV